MSTASPYVFWRGKMVARDGGTMLTQAEHDAYLEKLSIILEPLQRTPVPIIGPLIDAIWR